MAVYRVKQFLHSLFAKITKEDEVFIDDKLDEKEKNLFYKLPVYEQKHSLNVARDIVIECNKLGIDSHRLIKAALLHDLGKGISSINLIEKGIMVMLNRFFEKKLKNFTNIRFINVYYNHGFIAYEELKKFEKDEKLLYLVLNHHNDKAILDEELKILKKCDNKN